MSTDTDPEFITPAEVPLGDPWQEPDPVEGDAPVRMASRATISPKVIANLIVTLITFAATHYAIEVDPELAAAISAVLGAVAGYIAPPGNVETEPVPYQQTDDVFQAR